MKLIILFFLILCSFFLPGQQKSTKGINDSDAFLINFENNDYVDLEFDTLSVWQVGRPNKGNWTEAFNGENALITDTSKLLNQPIKTLITFKYERPWWSNCIRGWGIEMYYKHDFPYSKAGFYTEVSYDKGLTWYHIVKDTFLNISATSFKFTEKLQSGTYAISSIKDEIWDTTGILCQKIFSPDTVAAKVHNIWLRLVYENLDTVSHKGIIIDRLLIYFVHYCEFLSIDEFYKDKSKIYPNPITNVSILDFNNPTNQESIIEFYDLTGRIVMKKYSCNKSLELNRYEFEKGYYLYRVITNNKTIQKGKFIVQ